MNANIDRSDVKSNRFLNLTLFGYQTLHHLFPTLDLNLLPQLFELFEDTCMEFNIQVRQLSWWALTVGRFQQLARCKGRSIRSMRLWIDNYISDNFVYIYVCDYTIANETWLNSKPKAPATKVLIPTKFLHNFSLNAFSLEFTLNWKLKLHCTMQQHKEWISIKNEFVNTFEFRML